MRRNRRVECVVCRNKVSKKLTRQHRDGRACNSHFSNDALVTEEDVTTQATTPKSLITVDLDSLGIDAEKLSMETDVFLWMARFLIQELLEADPEERRIILEQFSEGNDAIINSLRAYLGELTRRAATHFIRTIVAGNLPQLARELANCVTLYFENREVPTS